MKPKIILLDWDGTLADVVPISAAAVNATRIHRGELPLEENEARRESAKALPILFPDPDDRQFFIDTHKRLSSENPPNALPGADSFVRYLNELRKNGIFVGIISNKPKANIEQEMKNYGWEKMFDVIIGSDNVAVGKPDPAPLAAALEHYPHKERLRQREILYVGDSNTDAAFAKNCAIQFLGIGNNFTLPLEPHEKCEDLHEALQRIKRLLPKSGPALPDF